MKNLRKFTALLLCIVMFCGCLPVFASAENLAHYQPPLRVPPLSDDLATRIFEVAKSQVGYQEDIFGGTYYGEWWTEVVNGRAYDDIWNGKIDIDCTDADWCAIFVCWCMEQAGAQYGRFFNALSGTVGYMFELLKAGGADIYEADADYVPKMGDLVFYSYDDGKSLSHVAVTDGNNNYVHANYANEVVINEGNRVYKISDRQYYTPMYTVSPNYALSELGGENILISSLMLFEASIIYFPARLSLELEKLFNTDDDDMGTPIIVSEVIAGDADRDGVLTAGDARLVLRAAVGTEKLSAEQLLRADLNKDGECTSDEARSILRASVGLEVL